MEEKKDKMKKCKMEKEVERWKKKKKEEVIKRER